MTLEAAKESYFKLVDNRDSGSVTLTVIPDTYNKTCDLKILVNSMSQCRNEQQWGPKLCTRWPESLVKYPGSLFGLNGLKRLSDLSKNWYFNTKIIEKIW